LWIIFFFIKGFVLVWDWFLFEEFIKLVSIGVRKGLVLYWILSFVILPGCWPVRFFFERPKKKEPKKKTAGCHYETTPSQLYVSSLKAGKISFFLFLVSCPARFALLFGYLWITLSLFVIIDCGTKIRQPENPMIL
jgi:hypothetical protein